MDKPVSSALRVRVALVVNIWQVLYHALFQREENARPDEFQIRFPTTIISINRHYNIKVSSCFTIDLLDMTLFSTAHLVTDSPQFG